MNENLDKYIILNRGIPSFIITFTFILFIIIISFIYISFNYNYKTYYNIFGTVSQENSIILVVPIDDMNYIIDGKFLYIKNKKYHYHINYVDSAIIENNFINYKKILISVSLPKKYQLNNYVIKGKIKKENKKIIHYILNYLGKE